GDERGGLAGGVRATLRAGEQLHGARDDPQRAAVLERRHLVVGELEERAAGDQAVDVAVVADEDVRVLRVLRRRRRAGARRVAGAVPRAQRARAAEAEGAAGAALRTRR